jgi:predicted kinase
MAECVIFVGLPGSGKTTFYRERFAQTHDCISKDAMPNTRNREGRQRELLRQALAAGRSVVIDNTNPAQTDRAPLIEIARSHAAAVVGYVFAATTREAIARNSRREGKGRVPNVAIFTTAKRFQRPTFDEGFDRLYGVQALDNMQFAVREVTREPQDESR